MSDHVFPLPDLVVASGQTLSNILYADGLISGGVTSGDGFRDARSITIHAPDTLPEVATVHVDSSKTATPNNFNPLQRGTTPVDVTVPQAESVTIELLSIAALRIVLGGAAGATRTFKVTKQSPV